MISLVQIETTSFCNAKCIFCPHKDLKRKKSTMSQHLFKKIIKDCKKAEVSTICPFLNGEPFMDDSIFDRMRYINMELPNTSISIFTNMSLLNDKKIIELSKIKNLNFIGMSLSFYNEKSCRENMNLDFDTVYKNVISLIKTNNTLNFVKQLEVFCIDFEDDKKNQRSSSFWNSVVGFDRFNIVPKQNWKGDIVSKKKVIDDIICPRTFHLCILSDGVVPLCCFDQEGKYNIGDVKINSILKIYNSEKYKEYRLNKKKNLMPCKYCTIDG